VKLPTSDATTHVVVAKKTVARRLAMEKSFMMDQEDVQVVVFGYGPLDFEMRILVQNEKILLPQIMA
jgi:hypothetical protein